MNSSQLTAQITSDDIVTAGTDNVTVLNPPPGGGSSNSWPFSIPCVLASAGPASNQTLSRLGAYYFDGWSGSLSNFHFDGLLDGTYQGREPLSGWQDNSPCAVEQQLAWAHEFGINFFVFDWYHNPTDYESDNLNNALQTTQSLPDRHGMEFAILYVDDGPFTILPADWTSVVDEWVGYMTDPDYVRVNGKPLLLLYDMNAMHQAFGSSGAVASAFNQLREAAQTKGLPGVYIVGDFSAGFDPASQTGSFPDLSIATTDGYDGVSMYNWWAGEGSGSQPFSTLSSAGEWIWQQVNLNSPVPFIPVAMDGWDARPWNEGNIWFTRSPADVTALVSSAIAWADSYPQFRPEPAPTPPLVLIEAWNEVGEGSYIVPTIGDGTSYGDSLAAMLTTQADKASTGTPSFSPNR